MKYKISLDIIDQIFRIGIALGQNNPKQDIDFLAKLAINELFNQLDKEKLE